MRTKKRVILGIAAVIFVGIAAACLWYARPLTIEDLCPGLELAQCTGIDAGYSTYDDRGLENRISLTLGDDLATLLDLFQGRQFRRSPFWWFSGGTGIHQWRDGDFRWSIDLAFEDVALPDGSFGSGYILHFNDFFGKLALRLGGTTWPVSTADQEQWLEEVMDYLLTLEPNTHSID